MTKRLMKESNNQWIGTVPNNWNVKRFKYVSNIYTGNSIKDNEKDNYLDSENAVPYISSKDITKGYNTTNYKNGMYVKNDDINFKRAYANDTLMCVEGGSAGIKKTYLLEDVAFVNKLCCFNAKGIDSKYQYYYLNSPHYEDEFFSKMSGMIGGVSVTNLSNINICLPSTEQQKKIANFLDSKCGEIDNLTKDIEHQIETLEEYKKSVITEAITKGLNSNVEMKDTGFQYWESIPNNWLLKDIKYIFEIVKRIAGKEGYDVISVTQKGLKFKDIDNNEGQIAADYSGYQFVYPNDYVMNHMDLLTGWVDCSTIFGVTSPDYRVFRLRNKSGNNLDYYKYVLQSCYFNKVFYSLGAGVSNLGRWRLQTDAFNNFLFPVPPVNEQEQIADYLNTKCSKIDSIILDKNKQLNILTKYKKSLIYEYVTGKKEVA